MAVRQGTQCGTASKDLPGAREAEAAKPHHDKLLPMPSANVVEDRFELHVDLV